MLRRAVFIIWSTGSDYRGRWLQVPAIPAKLRWQKGPDVRTRYSLRDIVE
ncbi:hypothetical protein [Microbulbifer sp. 2205BS26-8]|nr:hypothetical protein [Microbulbifer sp. 2205BS26-8]MDP5209155.1 hypothetical protein [Microbulbifer sp. 2205BS26-8]